MIKSKNKILTKINKTIIIIITLVCIFYSFKYFISKEYMKSLASVLTIFTCFFPNIISKTTNIKVPVIVKTHYLLMIFLSIFLGGIVKFYDYSSYDKFVHFISGILISWSFIVVFKEYYNNKNHYNIPLLYVVSFNVLMSVVWEICEYILDIVFSQNFQNGLHDTMLDMILAIFGGLLFIIAYFYRNKDKIQI